MRLSFSMASAVLAASAVAVVVPSIPGLRIQTPVEIEQNKNIPGDSPILLCDAEQPQVISIQSISISPNPPARGQTLNITASAFVEADIVEGSYIEVDVRYGYIRLLHQTYDLCEQIENVDLECPISKGQVDLAKSVELPNEIPPGKYLVVARAFSPDDELLTCLTAQVEFPVENLW